MSYSVEWNQHHRRLVRVIVQIGDRSAASCWTDVPEHVDASSESAFRATGFFNDLSAAALSALGPTAEPLDPTAVLRSKLAQIYALSQRLETHVHALPPGSMELIYRIGKLATQCPECDDSGIVADESTSRACERCSLTRSG